MAEVHDGPGERSKQTYFGTVSNNRAEVTEPVAFLEEGRAGSKLSGGS